MGKWSIKASNSPESDITWFKRKHQPGCETASGNRRAKRDSSELAGSRGSSQRDCNCFSSSKRNADRFTSFTKYTTTTLQGSHHYIEYTVNRTLANANRRWQHTCCHCRFIDRSRSATDELLSSSSESNNGYSDKTCLTSQLTSLRVHTERPCFTIGEGARKISYISARNVFLTPCFYVELLSNRCFVTFFTYVVSRDRKSVV